MIFINTDHIKVLIKRICQAGIMDIGIINNKINYRKANQIIQVPVVYLH